MDTQLAKSVIGVIRQEKSRRQSLLREQDPDFAYDQWLFRDVPFIAELCLMVLVALRHEVERELVRLAARAADNAVEISPQQYRGRIAGLRKGLGWDWDKIEVRLNLKCCQGHRQVEALRLLANSYKHDLSSEPGEALLKFLNLETGVPYVPLCDIGAVQENLALLIGLESEADYCDIAERFSEIVDRYLAAARANVKLSRVIWGAASLLPENFAR